MVKSHLTFVPIADAYGELQSKAMPQGTLPAEYTIANLVNGVFEYQHKVVLMNQGTVLQVLTTDNAGNFTVDLSQNAFNLQNTFINIELIDTYGDGSSYKTRFTQVSPNDNPPSTVVLDKNNNPQLYLVEVTQEDGPTVTRRLDYIGTMDTRPMLQSRVVLSPGETAQIGNINGDVVLKF